MNSRKRVVRSRIDLVFSLSSSRSAALIRQSRAASRACLDVVRAEVEEKRVRLAPLGPWKEIGP